MDKITIWILIENFYIAEGRVKVAILDPKIKRYTDLRKSVHQIAPKYFVMKESISGFFFQDNFDYVQWVHSLHFQLF